MLTSESLQFLYELSQNNNRDWFEKNKKRYETVLKKPFEAVTSAIIERLKSFEPTFAALQAKDCIHRIHRDVRFSADKSPYKTHVSAVFTSGGKQTMQQPGYYLHLEFGNLMLGGGAYFLDKEPLHRARTAIMQDTASFRKIIENQDFVSKYGTLKGELNKVLPPEFKAAAQQEPLLFQKQFYFMAELDPELSIGAAFPDLAVAYFKAGKAVNDFFRPLV